MTKHVIERIKSMGDTVFKCLEVKCQKQLSTDDLDDLLDGPTFIRMFALSRKLKS